MTDQKHTPEPVAWRLAWDRESLAMLQHPDGRIFRLEQLGKGGMWGIPDDNDEVCASLCITAMQGIRNPAAVRALVEAAREAFVSIMAVTDNASDAHVIARNAIHQQEPTK